MSNLWNSCFPSSMNSKKNCPSVFLFVIFSVQFGTFVAIFWEWKCFVQNGKSMFHAQRQYKWVARGSLVPLEHSNNKQISLVKINFFSFAYHFILSEFHCAHLEQLLNNYEWRITVLSSCVTNLGCTGVSTLYYGSITRRAEAASATSCRRLSIIRERWRWTKPS